MDQAVAPTFQARWKPETTHLAYWVGPWRLANPGLDLLVTREWTPEPLHSIGLLEALVTQGPLGPDGCLLFAHRANGPLPRLSRVGGLLCYVPQQYERRVADLTLGAEAYWAQFSSKTRFNLKRNIKLFAKATQDPVDWRRYTTPQEVAEFHHLALPLSERTYQHKLFRGGLPDSAAFKQQMLAAAERDDVRAYLLFKDAQPVAYLYFEAEDGMLAYSYVGHEAELSSLSPGSVLMALAIEQIQNEGRYRWMDFGSGDGQHKAVFSTGVMPVAHVYLLKPTWRNRCIVFTHDLLSRTMDSLRAWLKKNDLHSRLKRWVRQRASGA